MGGRDAGQEPPGRLAGFLGVALLEDVGAGVTDGQLLAQLARGKDLDDRVAGGGLEQGGGAKVAGVKGLFLECTVVALGQRLAPGAEEAFDILDGGAGRRGRRLGGRAGGGGQGGPGDLGLEKVEQGIDVEAIVGVVVVVDVGRVDAAAQAGQEVGHLVVDVVEDAQDAVVALEQAGEGAVNRRRLDQEPAGLRVGREKDKADVAVAHVDPEADVDGGAGLRAGWLIVRGEDEEGVEADPDAGVRETVGPSPSQELKGSATRLPSGRMRLVRRAAGLAESWAMSARRAAARPASK